MKFLKLLLAIIAGTFAGSLFIYAFQAIGQIIFPPPFAYDPANPDIFIIMPATASRGILWIILISYAAGSLAAGFMAGIISSVRHNFASLASGFALMIFGLSYLFRSYHPLWFWLGSLVIYFTFAWFGGLIAQGGRE